MDTTDENGSLKVGWVQDFGHAKKFGFGYGFFRSMQCPRMNSGLGPHP